MEKYYRYIRRTVEHIHRVQSNMVTVVTDFKGELKLSEKDCRELMFNVMKHDRSKFSIEQFKPYIELTEYYHQRKKMGNTEYNYGAPEMEDMVNKAVENHYCVENHHPERFKLKEIGYYTQHEAIETVCDLQAMAQEFNEGTCRKYFEEVWRKKQVGNLYDDCNWWETMAIMNSVINCFESRLNINSEGK